MGGGGVQVSFREGVKVLGRCPEVSQGDWMVGGSGAGRKDMINTYRAHQRYFSQKNVLSCFPSLPRVCVSQCGRFKVRKS